jgi:hypothetical protein
MRDVSRYHTELEAAHTILAQTCIGVLLRLDDHVDRDKIKDFPLAQYAAEYWPRHANLEVYRHRSRMGWNVFLTKTNHTLQRGCGSTMACILCTRGNLEQSPYFTRQGSDFVNWLHTSSQNIQSIVNARTDRQDTTMHVATKGGNTDILSLLLEHDADVDSRDRSRATPLHWASARGGFDIGQCLLDHGADFNARDKDSVTPLFDAARQGHVEFAQLLLERGALIDAQSKFGRTPLSWAVGSGNIQVARLLTY